MRRLTLRVLGDDDSPSRSAPNGLPVGGRLLPGYLDGRRRLLTREGVDLFAAMHAAEAAKAAAHVTRGSTGGVSPAPDGTLDLGALVGGSHVIRPETLVNHWRDAVDAWAVPAALFRPTLPFAPDAPFTVAGETVASLTFAACDAQHGDEAPWHGPASSPRPWHRASRPANSS